MLLYVNNFCHLLIHFESEPRKKMGRKLNSPYTTYLNNTKLYARSYISNQTNLGGGKRRTFLFFSRFFLSKMPILYKNRDT